MALVERDRLGGTCLNRGCIPTKALARSAEALHEVKHASDMGIKVGDVELGKLLYAHHPDLTIRNRFGGIAVIPASLLGP